MIQDIYNPTTGHTLNELFRYPMQFTVRNNLRKKIAFDIWVPNSQGKLVKMFHIYSTSPYLPRVMSFNSIVDAYFYDYELIGGEYIVIEHY